VTVTIKSKEQLLGTWVRRIKNNTDITDFKAGGALVTLMEAVAQQVYQAQLSVLKVLEITEVDNLTETRLDDFAESLKIPNGQGGIGRKSALQSTGLVSIGSSFKKILTRAYAGKPAPYAGSTVIYVQDASEMFAKAPVNGKIYIGRNTIDSFEGPLSYSSISTTGTYWIINLVDPLTKDHAYTDEIVLAQGGDRAISAATVVQVPSYSDAPSIQFTTDATVILADGEDSAVVSVTCTQFGVVGNVASGAITEFASPPFSDANVINNIAFVNGSDTEADAALRLRIKDYPNTLARGTIGAINSALLSVVDAETKKKVVSASVIRPLEKGEPTTVYIDDGALLEPVFIGQDYELLLAKASGLEQSFRTAQSPITPATVLGVQSAPYVLQAGMTITFLIDNIPYVYTITPSNYKDLTAATTYEVVRDLNSDAEGILDFRVVENGTKIVAIDRTNLAEEIRVIAGDLQAILGFSTVSQRPIYLYKNGILQSFKGKTATISSNPFSNWSITGAPYTGLQAVVDGVTISVADITNVDFLTRFGVTMSAATADNWREVLQSKIAGVTVIFQDNRFIITSNKENSSSSQVTVSAGDWIGVASIFSPELTDRTSVGASKDYTLNRYTGDIRFVSRLQAGDIIEIASINTRAFVKSTTTSTGQYDLSNDYPGFGSPKIIAAVDGDVEIKTTGNLTDAVIQVTDIDANALTLSLTDKYGNGLFINAKVDDYIYFASVKQDALTPLSGFSSITDGAVGLYKIKQIVRGLSNVDTIVVEISSFQATTAFILNDEYDASYLGTSVFKIFSSTVIPQIMNLTPTATATVENVANQINAQIIGAAAERSTGQYFFLRTNTYIDGTISIVSTFGKASNLFSLKNENSIQSHVGSSMSGYLDGGFPIVNQTITPSSPSAGYAARSYLEVVPNYTEVTQTFTNPTIQSASTVVSYPSGFQETWVTGKLSGWTGRVYNTETTAPFAGFMRTDSAIKPIGAINVTADTINRYSNISFKLQDLSITPFDKFVVEMDLDPSNKTVTLPLYKKAVISNEQLVGTSGRGQKFQFTLKDPEDFDKEFFDVTSPFKNFDFNDFKVVGRSVGVYKLNSTSFGPNEAALVVRSSSFGGANRINFNIVLPQTASKADITINHSNIYKNSEVRTIVTAEMASQSVIPSTIYNIGSYKVSNLSTSNNLTDITLSTFNPAVTATAKIESLPAYDLTFFSRAAGFAGVLGNNIELIVQNSGRQILFSTRTINNIQRQAQVVTITTSTPHGFYAGQRVTIDVNTNTGIEGTFTIVGVPTANTFTYAQLGSDIPSTADTGSAQLASEATNVSTIINIAKVAQTVTVSTNKNHGYLVGQRVTVNASAPHVAINGTFTITTVTPASFSYSQSGADIPSASATGSATGLVALVAQSTKKVTLDLFGTSPNAAELTAALAASTYLELATGIGNLSINPLSYNYLNDLNEIAASVSNLGANTITLTMNQIDYSPSIRGGLGNSWSIQCVNTGSGPTPSVSVNYVSKEITLNLQGNTTYPISNLPSLLDAVLPNAILCSGYSVSPTVYIQTFGKIYFTNGRQMSNKIITSGGADQTDGAFAGLYQVNNLLKITGVQSSVSMPIGVWPIVAKPSAAELTVRVPNYNGLSTAVALNTTFNAAQYQLQSYAVAPKTLKDLADAINLYLSETPVISATTLGDQSTDVLMPTIPQPPRATYLNYTNTNTLLNINNPSEALLFHAFLTNRSEGGSIYNYDSNQINPLNNKIESVVQSIDSMFPSGAAILGTAYSSVGEEVYLMPTNAATFNRWANFAPISSLSTQSDVMRASGASKIQISSKLRGTSGAVYPKDTLANNYSAIVLEAASEENGAAFFPLLTAQTKSLPNFSMVEATNALTSNLLRPFRVASVVENQTAANTANEKTWFRVGAKIIYEQATSTRGRLYFLRNGQTSTISGISVVGVEPLTAGAVITVNYNTPSAGLATISCNIGTLSARIGDMMYVRSAGFSSEINCPLINSGLCLSTNLYSSRLSGYVGYPVVQVNNSTEIIIIAPNLTQNHSLTLTSNTDLVFVPSVYAEKNIKTNYKAGPQGVEVLGNTPTQGTHAEPVSGVYSYGILKKLSNGFSALILSNTSDGANIPDSQNDTMLLAQCGVNTDDYVFLNGFGAGADGQYQLVAHDGKNTAIIYNPILPIQDIVYDSAQRVNNIGKTWWGKELQVADNNPADYTIDPRPVRIVDAESVLLGCKISIASAAEGTTNWFSQPLVGVWTITGMGFYGPSSDICPYIEFDMPNGAPPTSQLITVAAANEDGIRFVEKTPFTAFRLVQGWSIDPKNPENSQLYLAPAKSYQKISNSLGTEIKCVHKLGYEIAPKVGVDGYKIFGGLIREAQRTIDGVPTSINRYAGIKSTGTDVSILPPIPRSVAITFRVRTRDGISINAISAIIRSTVVSFISGLGIGQPVILSEIIGLVQNIAGVTSVEVVETLPLAVDGRIPVADNEKVIVVDPPNNINVGK
jgi:Baseplate J-like protein